MGADDEPGSAGECREGEKQNENEGSVAECPKVRSGANFSFLKSNAASFEDAIEMIDSLKQNTDSVIIFQSHKA